MVQAERPELITGRQLVETEIVEQLVRDERIPFFSKGYIGENRTFVWIPPKGTKLGDTMTWVTGGAGYGFYSPEGELRGLSQLIDVDLEVGKSLEARVNAVRAALRNPQ